MTFCPCSLDSFKPGHFQDPVACRAKKNLLLVMATGRAGKGRAASFSGKGGCCLLTATLETQHLTPRHCLVGCPLTPDQLNSQRSGHPTAAHAPDLPAACGTPSHQTRAPSRGIPASLLLAFSPTKLFLRSSQAHFEQLIYLLGNNCSSLAPNKPLCLAATWECNMSFTKLSQESTDRLQKYALYSVHLNE